MQVHGSEYLGVGLVLFRRLGVGLILQNLEARENVFSQDDVSSVAEEA